MPDFFDLARHFTPEERAIRDSVRAFVDARVLPTIADHWEHGHLPDGAHPRDRGARASSAATCTGYGCAGLSDVGYGLAMQELERGDSGIRSLRERAGVARHVPDPRVRLRGAEANATCRRWRKGEIIGCFGLTEPDFGSNPGGMRTRRDRRRRQLRPQRHEALDHQRQPRPGRARLGQGRRTRTARSAASSSRPTRSGFEARLIHKKVSLRASVTSELILEDVRVPKDAILPGVRGMKGPLSCADGRALRHRVGRHRRGDRRASTARSTTRSTACSSRASRSRRTSSCRPSSPRC